MQASAKLTLCNLVEEHITSLVREAAVVQRHTKRARFHQSQTSTVNTINNSSIIPPMEIPSSDGGVGVNRRINPDNGNQNENIVEDRQNEGGNISGLEVRRVMQAEDINLALQWRGSEKIYTTNAGGVVGSSSSLSAKPTSKKQMNKSNSKSVNNKTIIDLNAFIRSDALHRPPTEIGMTLHWLAVDGVQPLIPQNPVEFLSPNGSSSLLPHMIHGNNSSLAVHTVEDEEDDDLDDTTAMVPNNNSSSNNSNATSNNSTSQHTAPTVSVRHLLPRILSEELRLYFTRVTLTIERGTPSHQDAALASLSTDTGIQELVPFFARFVSKQIYSSVGNAAYCRTLVRLAAALVRNRNIHLELHLHQMLPALLTCVVARRLKTFVEEDHWSLRVDAARTIVEACCLFGEEYSTLKARIIRTFCEAMEPEKPLGSVFGGIVGVSLFGSKAVDAFVLPIASAYYSRWERELEEGIGQSGVTGACISEERRFEVQRCQDALLNAIGVFLGNVSQVEQSKRLNPNSLADVFGEKLIPLHGNIEQYDYLGCFI